MRSRGLGVVLAAAAAASLGCAPGDDGVGPPRDGATDRPTEDGGGGEADVPADEASWVDDGSVGEATDGVLDQVCGEEDLPLEYDVDSDLLVVLDRSASMTLTLSHLKNAVNAIAAASGDRIWMGLMPFPSSVAPNACNLMNPFTECNAPAAPQVEPGPDRAAAIADALGPMRICGSTPTSATLRNAHAFLRSAAGDHHRYVLLATDGVPNCNDTLDGTTCTCLDTESGCASNPRACLDDAATYAAIDALRADGIPTYVLAMGSWSGADRAVLDAMAVHGGTGHFYPAERPDEILSVFEAIMGTIVVSCRFDLHPGDTVDPTQVNLYVGGEVVPRDPSHGDGWDYLDEDTVEFYGPACDAILGGGVGSVGAAYGCPTVLI